MNIKKIAALTGVSLSLIGMGILVPTAANATSVHTDGLNVCKTVKVKHTKPAWQCVSLMPGYNSCTYYTTETVCTRY